MLLNSLRAFGASFAVWMVISAAAQAIVIDDFQGALSSEYNQSTVESVGTRTYSATTSANPGQLTIAATAGSGTAQQDAFLRSDFSLDVGETLRTDLISGTSRDLTGLMIATTDNPTNRNNSIVIGFAGNTGSGRSWYFDNSGTFTFENFGVTGTMEELFIRRTAEESYDLGYVNDADTEFVVRTVSTAAAGNLDPGAAIGYLVDLNDGQSVVFDNLAIDNEPVAIPEPLTISMWVLLGAFVLGFESRRRAARR